MTHNMWSHDWTTTECPEITPRKATPPHARGDNGNTQIHRRTLEEGHHQRVMEPIHSQFLLYKEERWKNPTRLRLQTPKQVDNKEPKRITTHTGYHWLPQWMHSLHQIWHQMGVQQYQNKTWRWVESGLPHSQRCNRLSGVIIGWTDISSGTIPLLGSQVGSCCTDWLMSPLLCLMIISCSPLMLCLMWWYYTIG